VKAACPGEPVARRGGDNGEAMVIWCLLLALMILPLASTSVDLWHAIAVQRQLQAAAEDAALAGSSGLDVEAYRSRGCISLAPSSAVALADENLADQQGLGPLSASRVAVTPGGWQISVWLEEQVHLTLLSLLEGGRSLAVSATAVSGPRGSVSGSGCPGDVAP